MSDNRSAKSYIEAVMARADADLVVRTDAPCGDWGFTRTFFVVDKATGAELGEFRGGVISCFSRPGTAAKNNAARDAAEVCAERINAATTLAKIALRAIEALEDIRVNQGKVCGEFELCNHAACQSSCASYMIADATLAEINDMAKGSQ